MIYLNYLALVLKHKYFVFRAGLKTGVSIWRLIIHDWTKFTPKEFGAYARKTAYGFNTYPRDPKIEADFASAWLHHENHNPHHWGYWIPRSGQFRGEPMQMPETYIREMVADWMGASMAYSGSWDMKKWLNKSIPVIAEHMHPATRVGVDNVLMELGYVSVGGEYE